MTNETVTATSRLERMTLEEKVGQVFTFYNTGTTYSAFTKEMIERWKVGGIFLDMGSLENPEQVHRLTTDLQRASLTGGSGLPLFISADFVAGAGCKLRDGGAVHFPKNKAVGVAADEALAYESGRVTAMESLAMGVNFNYSPVMDINNNPRNPVIGTHSFGEDRDLVAAMGCQVIRGTQDNGMVATAKHFPGHGDTQVDSHFDLPVLPFDRERLDRFELAPFRAAIAAGVDAVMVGHIAVPALDPTLLPASLSYEMTTKLLREELGFDGLIVTDGLSMKGVTAKFTQAEACVMALQAGADILLAFAKTEAEAAPMVEAVLRAVESGELTEERLDRSVRLILEKKAKYGLLAESFDPQPFEANRLQRPEALRVSDELARKAVRSRHGFSPLGTEREGWHLIWDAQLDPFARRVREAGAADTERKLASYEELAAALGEIPTDRPVLLALTHNKPIPDETLERLNRLAAEREGAVKLIHFGSPYDLDQLPQVPALSLADRAPSLQQAAADCLLG
ncbi:beta-N-acetylhexosaminidase [Paenibacillus sp. J31TS4]|uniref:glycoside hydrolase family 3 protein n=1 Tax=Paenibacillus sp. J31TS4 TaxID=2807195 RepID=UPI001B020739|nr:glycoside hydrolase family 3 N-terminal domain-containing protein [Paenibacillus sp. J31TS4]GIP37773.1 beta-N-acetylhexosaminidase [Paenibacillus sp. J31TS4]